MMRMQRLPAIAQPLHRPRPEIPTSTVGLLEQPLEDLPIGVRS